MWRFLALALLVVLMGVTGARQAHAGGVFIVDSSSDDVNLIGCLDQVGNLNCNLRSAIILSNTDPTMETIVFALGGGVPTISPESPLPAITQPVDIDGASGGATAIELDGVSGADGPDQADGLRLLNHTGSTIKNMVVSGWDTGVGIFLIGGGSHTIVGNTIGTDASGQTRYANKFGVSLLATTNNTIGGDSAHPNLISGSLSEGVTLDEGANSNTVSSNIIGLSRDQTTSIPNNTAGVSIIGSGNQIGTEGHANVISGNGGSGVRINGTGNSVQADLIGVNSQGQAKPNSQNGIFVGINATSTVIGGSLDVRNVISGNAGAGVHIESGAGVDVSGNIIGLNALGTSPIPNQGDGIEIVETSDFTTAGLADTDIEIGKPQVPNTISGNAGSGIAIFGGTEGVSVRANNIGVNLEADTGLGNGAYGIHIDHSQNNTIGGFEPEEGNFITTSSEVGIFIDGSGSSAEDNSIRNNWVGGKPDIGGNGVGIRVIADFTAIMDNTIVNNFFEGVSITGNSNHISGNSIGSEGVGPTGGNGAHGIVISGNNNRIGPVLLVNAQAVGTQGGILGNVISNNGGAGILVEEGTGNTISLNSIGNNDDGGIDLAPEGPTPNDEDDPDTGANNLQNFPVLTSATILPNSANGAVIQGGGTRVEGSLNSNPNATFELEFFASESCTLGPITGKGEDYLGTLEVTTNASGDAEFSIVIGAALEVGEFVTATATHDLGSTSEFSNCVTPTPSTGTPTPTPVPTELPGDADCDDDVDLDDFIAALSEVAGVPPGAACEDSVGCEDPIDARDALDILKYVVSPADYPLPLC